jgi:hypothetical protein
VIRLVSPADLRKTLDEMEIDIVFATVVCPFCKSVNLFPGFTDLLAFRCRRCHSFVDNS